MLNCAICKKGAIDLTNHIRLEHQMTADQYKEQFNLPVVDSSVEEKRKATCLKKYGDPNYKNEEAKKLSNEIFEGGHSLSDPAIRAKACDTKKILYGDSNYTNREQAKATCLEKYGVENVAHIPGVQEKKVNTLMQRYGKVFNWERKDVFTREELEDLHCKQGLTLGEIGNKFGQTAEGISYWMKKLGIPVTKRVVSPKFKEYTDSKDDVRSYIEKCLSEKKVLSFSEYGKLTSNNLNQKLKRLFNTGKKYAHLKDELFSIALKPELWETFLAKLC